MKHTHNHNHNHDATGSIKVAFFLNLLFALIEIAGGYFTNSMAILSDALHDLGDSFALGLSWYLERFSIKGKDNRYSYGYRRFSLLAALANTIILLIGSLFILSEAIPRLMNPQHSNAEGMIAFAILGIVVNGIAVLRLRREKSISARVVAWHLIEDVLGWAAVLVVSITLLVRDIHILDPLLSILITLYVLYNVINNLKKTLALFLQAVPEGVDINEIEKRLLAIAKVQSIHHIHVWSLDGEHHVLTAHMVVDEDTTPKDQVMIKEKIKELASGMGFEHTTIEIELEQNCSMN